MQKIGFYRVFILQRALRVLKSISIKLTAYALAALITRYLGYTFTHRKHVFFENKIFYYSLITILFQDATAATSSYK